MSRFRTVLVIVAVLAGLYYAFGRAGGDGGVGGARPPVLVRTAAVERRDVALRALAPGLVVPRDSVAVKARIDSEIVSIHFREGDDVRAGDVLFRLDDRALAAELARQQALLATDRAALENATRQYRRAESLAGEGFESTARLDQTRADYESAAARARATEAEIERLRVELGYTEIRAAIDGRAGVIHATAGNTVKANADEPLVTIHRIRPILVQIGLPQQALALLRAAGAEGQVEVLAVRDGETLPGKGVVVFIDNAVDRTTGTVEVRAEFANDADELWPGMIVELQVTLGRTRDATTVPEVAVQHGPTGDFVFTIDDGVAKLRRVEVERYGEGWAVVSAGVTVGETVAVDGMVSLVDGAPVELAAGEKGPEERASR